MEIILRYIKHLKLLSSGDVFLCNGQLHLNSTHPIWKICKTSKTQGACKFRVDKQGCQLSRIECESHGWTLFLTLSVKSPA